MSNPTKAELKDKLKAMQHFLSAKTFAENKLRFSNREIDLSELDYTFSVDELTSTEILEIANDSVVKSNIQQITVDLLKFDMDWNYENSSKNVNEYVKSLFDESKIGYSIDWEKYVTQSTDEKIKFGWVDFYFKWSQKLKTIEKIIPLDQERTTVNTDGSHTYQDSYGSYPVENIDGFVPEYIQVKYNDDSRNRRGKTTFNRQMLNYVRFKKRLVILKDLAMDKAAIPAVIAMINPDVQTDFDLTNTDTTATNGLVAYQALITKISSELSQLSSGNGTAISGVDKIQTLQNNINPEMYSKFKAMADEELAIPITGTAITTQQTNKGSYASSEVGLTIQDSIKQMFARLIQKEINEIIRISVAVQFGKDVVAPYFVFSFIEKPSNEEKLEWYNGGEKIKAEEAPSFIYLEEGQEFIQKQAPTLGFSEKKKTLSRPLLS